MVGGGGERDKVLSANWVMASVLSVTDRSQNTP